MLNSFWDDKNRKPNKFERPKKTEIKERRANIRITQADKEIGRTTVVKKPHEKSEYWRERPSKKSSHKAGHWVEKKVGEKSTMGLQRENFVTQESDELDVEILRDTLDEQEKKITHLITRLNTQEEEFEKYKKKTQEVLNLITEALKVEVKKQETSVDISVEKSSEEEPPVHRRTYFQSDPILREITLNFLHEVVYPFGKRTVNNYKKGEECSFSFKTRNDECYAYGHFSTDEKGYLTIEIDEFTKESGKEINKKDIRFPMTLHYIEESGSSESSESDSDNEVEVETESVQSIKEPEIEEEPEVVEEVEEPKVVEEVDEPEIEEPKVVEVIEESEVVEEVEEHEIEETREVVEEVEEPKEGEVIEENHEVIEDVEEPEIEETHEVVEEVEEPKEDEVIEEPEIEENHELVEEVNEPESEVVEEPEVIEEPEITTETIKLVVQPISKSDSETTSESKESPVLELPRVKLPAFTIPQFKKI